MVIFMNMSSPIKRNYMSKTLYFSQYKTPALNTLNLHEVNMTATGHNNIRYPSYIEQHATCIVLVS